MVHEPHCHCTSCPIPPVCLGLGGGVLGGGGAGGMFTSKPGGTGLGLNMGQVGT